MNYFVKILNSKISLFIIDYVMSLEKKCKERLSKKKNKNIGLKKERKILIK